MSKRGLAWLRQHTNVEDLLDDGIENNSDVSSFAPSGEDPDDPIAAKPAGTPLPAAQIVNARTAIAEPDFFVAAIAVLVIGCGAALIIHPVDEIVYHANSIEHVANGRSVLYGVVGILLASLS